MDKCTMHYDIAHLHHCIRLFSLAVFFPPFVSLFGEIRTSAWRNSTASCPFPRPQGASLAMCLLRQIGGGASAVEIPCKDL